MAMFNIVSKVVEEPRVSIGKGVNCLVSVEVQGDAGAGYETYDVIISRGSKPWQVAVGTKACAVGVLKGDTLWADYFREYSPPGRSRW